MQDLERVVIRMENVQRAQGGAEEAAPVGNAALAAFDQFMAEHVNAFKEQSVKLGGDVEKSVCCYTACIHDVVCIPCKRND